MCGVSRIIPCILISVIVLAVACARDDTVKLPVRREVLDLLSSKQFEGVVFFTSASHPIRSLAAVGTDAEQLAIAPGNSMEAAPGVIMSPGQGTWAISRTSPPGSDTRAFEGLRGDLFAVLRAGGSAAFKPGTWDLSVPVEVMIIFDLDSVKPFIDYKSLELLATHEQLARNVISKGGGARIEFVLEK